MPPQTVLAEKRACGQILKASAIIGGSSLATVAIGVVRTKVVAVLLGPAGFGLMGLYSSIMELGGSIATMGVNSSGVRQIADAVGSGDSERVARTATVLRRVSLLLGLLGAGLLILLAGPLADLTFADENRAGSIALLSLAVFFACVSGGQGALIQGLRRISDLARVGVLGALFGTALTILLVYFLGESGIVPALVGVAAMTALTSWWYARKVPLQGVPMSTGQVGAEAAALLKLGFAFMASALMMTGTAYAVRLLLLQESGFEAAGLYQSAWTLGGLYTGFILQAMGTDFYPRLTGVARDNPACNRMVNQQAQISLLLAGPGIIGTLTLAPLVITLFYSARFQGAVEILRWLCLGMALRVMIWPIGYIILAKGAQRLYFLTELAWTVVYLALARAGIESFGPVGAGMAFFGAYAIHGLVVYLVVRQLSGFRWQAENQRGGLLFLAVTGVVFGGFSFLPPPVAIGLGVLATASSAVHSIRVLLTLVSEDGIPSSIARLLVRFRLFAPGPR